MNLIGKKVKLEPLALEDNEILYKLINDPELEHFVVGWSKPVTLEQQKNWFLNLNENRTIRYSIKIQDKTVGFAIIDDIDWKNRSCSFGIKLVKDYRGEGVGKETITLLLDYVFNQLNLHSVSLQILDYNTASQKLFESCGFKREGRIPDAVFKNGKYNDILIYSKIKENSIYNV